MAEPRIARLDEVASAEEIARLPYSLRVLLENVLRAGEEKEVSAVLACPPGEEHDLGLLALGIVLRARG